MAIVKQNTYVPGTNNDITNVCTNVDLNRLGTDLSYIVYSGGQYVLKSGSLVEINGSLYSVTADINLGNNTGNLIFNDTTVSFSISATTGTYNAAKAGEYSASNIRVLKWATTAGGVHGIRQNVIGQSLAPTFATGISIGTGNTSTQSKAIAIGYNVSAIGTGGVAIGDSTGTGAGVVIGMAANASDGSVSIGNNVSNSIGVDSIAIGKDLSCQGSEVVNIGNNNVNTGNQSISYGIDNTATLGICIGKSNNTSLHTNATSIGVSNNASNDIAIAIGYGNTASGIQSTAVGISNVTSANYAISSGRSNIASADYASSFGYGNTASGIQSTSFGHGNTASGIRSTSFGYSNTASMEQSTAAGYDNLANGVKAVAVGHSNQATNDDAVSIGILNTASQARSTAIGYNTGSIASDAVAVGNSVECAVQSASIFGTSVNSIALIPKASVKSTVKVMLDDIANAVGTSFPCFYPKSMTFGGGSKIGYLPEPCLLYRDTNNWILVNSSGTTIDTIDSSAGTTTYAVLLMDNAR